MDLEPVVGGDVVSEDTKRTVVHAVEAAGDEEHEAGLEVAETRERAGGGPR